MTKIKKIFYLFFPLLTGSIVGLIISNFIDYNTLIKPKLSPPSFIFPIIWSIIYILLGISYYLYKKEYFNNTLKIDITYYSGLLVNLLWSVFFFIFKLRYFTIIWTILLVILITYLIYLFIHKHPLSAYLNIPYLFWCIFALYLTIGIYILN